MQITAKAGQPSIGLGGFLGHRLLVCLSPPVPRGAGGEFFFTRFLPSLPLFWGFSTLYNKQFWV